MSKKWSSVRANRRVASQQPSIFAHLPRVLRQLRGTKTSADVARGTGLAQAHLYQLEDRPVRYSLTGRSRPARPGKLPSLGTLDVLLRYYGVSLCSLNKLLLEADEESRADQEG